MQILKYELLSKPGVGTNEDVARVLEFSAWVLDGASGLSINQLQGVNSDAHWFVKEWDNFLKDNISDNKKNLKEILKQGVPIIKEKYYRKLSRTTINELNTPSCSIVIIRFYENTLEYFVLGDCTIVVENRSSNTIQSITDDRVSRLDNIVIKKISKFQKQKKINSKKEKEEILNLLQRHRKLKNSERGYWILEFDQNAIEHGIYQLEVIDSEINLLLMSDGFSRLYNTFKLTENASELLLLAKKIGLKELYKKLKDFSNKDKKCLRFPRLSKIDDASGILLKLRRE